MDKKSIRQLNISDIFGRRFNLSWLFFLLFLILIFLEILEIKNSLNLALTVSRPPEPVAVRSDISNRVDFVSYEQIVQRIQNASSFQPTVNLTNDPFNPSAPQAQPPAQTTSPRSPSTSTSTAQGGQSQSTPVYNDSSGVLQLP